MQKLQEIQQVLEQTKSLCRDAFREFFDEVFKTHPTIVSISWRQYTPYFCDGDPTEFSSHWWDGVVTHSDGEQTDLQLKQKYMTLLGKLSKEVWLSAFGDHTKVTVTADKIVLDDYFDHN